MNEFRKSSSVSPHEYFKRVLNHSNEPFVGLEYIILFPYPKLTIKPFHCALCDKSYDENVINNHLISTIHRRKYLNLNFPPLLKFLYSKQVFFNDVSKREIILTKVAQNLQQFLSQSQQPVIDLNEFKENRSKIITEMTKESEILNDKKLKKII